MDKEEGDEREGQLSRSHDKEESKTYNKNFNFHQELLSLDGKMSKNCFIGK